MIFLSGYASLNAADIKGRVTYNKKRDERYEAGIQFIDIDKKKTEILKQFAIMFKDEINK